MFINEKMEIKLGDFGLATKLEFDGEKKKTICGTPNYIAPEILDGKVGHSYEVDIWSLGCILCELATGRPIFPAQDENELMEFFRMRIGMAPFDMIQNCKKRRQFFDSNN